MTIDPFGPASSPAQPDSTHARAASVRAVSTRGGKHDHDRGHVAGIEEGHVPGGEPNEKHEGHRSREPETTVSVPRGHDRVQFDVICPLAESLRFGTALSPRGLLRVPELIEAKRSVETNDLESENDEPDEGAGTIVRRVVGGDSPLSGKPHDEREEDESHVQQGSSPFVHALVEIDVLYHTPPEAGSEKPVPRKERGWKESVRSWVKWRRDTTRNCEATIVEQKRILDSFPRLFRRCEIGPPSAPSKVTREMVRKVWADSPLAPTTTCTHMVALRVKGKGTFGGKYRTIPLAPQAFVALNEASVGKQRDDRVCPWTKHTADKDVLRAAERAKLRVRVSGHDLRRSLARISIRAGANPANVQKVRGHACIDPTLTTRASTGTTCGKPSTFSAAH